MKPELLTDEQIDVIEQRIYCQTIQKGKTRGEYVFKVSRAIEAAVNAKWQEMLKQEAVFVVEEHSIKPLRSMQLNVGDKLYAAPQSAQQEPDPTHPQYVAGFKAGRYAGLRRIEASPETAPKPTIGSVKCPKCNTQFAAFQVQQPAQQELRHCACLFDESGCVEACKLHGQHTELLRKALSDLIEVTEHLNPCPATLQAAKEALHEQS